MKITIPNQNWVQVNKGERLGSINASWNLDLLSNAGNVKISPQVLPTADTNLSGLPTAFAKDITNGRDYALCGAYIYYWKVADLAWDAHINVVETNNPECNLYYDDMTYWNGGLLVTVTGAITTGVSRLASGTWTPNWYVIVSGGSLLSGYPHPLCIAYNNLLLIGNKNNVVSITTADAVDTSAVVLPSEYTIEWIKSSSTGVWIGTKNIMKGEAKVFYWDGYSENYNAGYVVGSESCFSGAIGKDNIPYVLNGYGQLLKFNGSSFQEVARFEVANAKTHYLRGYFGTFTDADGLNPIHRNGMAIIDDKVHILLNATIDGDSTKLLENQLSGIWCYTEENGLFHRFSLTQNYGTAKYDLGYPIISQAGAIIPRPKRLGSFYAGYTTYLSGLTGGGTSRIGIVDTTDTRQKIAYFTLPKIYAEGIDEMWNNITAIHKELVNPEDYIKVKYRFVKGFSDLQTLIAGTWTGSNTFTATIGEMEVDDEVEIVTGRGAGMTTKITDITCTTITIADHATAGSGTFYFRSERWTEVDTIQDLVSRFNKFSIDKNNTQIQFKVILFGKGDSPELEKLILNSSIQEK